MVEAIKNNLSFSKDKIFIVESSTHIAIYLLLNIPSSIGQNSVRDIFLPITLISGLVNVLSNSKYNNSLFSKPTTNWLFVALAQHIVLDDFKKVVFFLFLYVIFHLVKLVKMNYL